MTKHQNITIFGEDTGKIGDVNQGLEGMQIKHGKNRVDDRGIREATIVVRDWSCYERFDQ